MRLLLFNLRTDAADPILGFTSEWIRELAGHCEQIHVITMFRGSVALPSNVRVSTVGGEDGTSRPRRFFEFYRVLHRVLAAERFDACFAHMMPLFAVLGWPALRLRRIPILLWYAHGHIPRLVRLAERLVARIVTSTPDGFRLPSPKLRIIGQGIDTKRFRPAPRDPGADSGSGPLVLVSVGRISRVKRLETQIEALGLLEPELRARVILRIVGGPLSLADRRCLDELVGLAARLGLDQHVEFVPPLAHPEVHRAFQGADLFLNTSDTNSLDKAGLEAVSSGVPILTTNPAFRQILTPDLIDLCLIPKNRPDLLASRISELLKWGPPARAELAAKLRAVVERDHSLGRLASQIHAELAELAEQSRGSR
jgi:glycosyltransferase involved in cell wall biosynthesis